MTPINLGDVLSTFDEYWQPRVVGGFNGHDLMVVKVKGEFVVPKGVEQLSAASTGSMSC